MPVTATHDQADPAESLRAAYDVIEKNLHREDLTPASVAGAIGVSVRQLHVLFVPTGQSFSRYVMSRRIERIGAQLKHHPDRPVLDIVLACGIRSSSVFYRAFREVFGMNPSNYRQSLREAAGGSGG